MYFTVKTLFNPSALGLSSGFSGPHYALCATLPQDLGGGDCVVDVLPASDVDSKEELVEGFAAAVGMMPYERGDLGLKIRFLNKDHRGTVYQQSTLYAPEKSATGETMKDAYLGWLCYRARVGLWAAERDRVTLSSAQQADLLNPPTVRFAAPRTVLTAETAPV